jgi:hypothetical protein
LTGGSALSKSIYTKRRARIAKEIVQSVPHERIMVAAALVMAHQRGVKNLEPTMEEISDWIEHQDADHLLKLRKIAEGLEGGIEH